MRKIQEDEEEFEYLAARISRFRKNNPGIFWSLNAAISGGIGFGIIFGIKIGLASAFIAAAIVFFFIALDDW